MLKLNWPQQCENDSFFRQLFFFLFLFWLQTISPIEGIMCRQDYVIRYSMNTILVYLRRDSIILRSKEFFTMRRIIRQYSETLYKELKSIRLINYLFVIKLILICFMFNQNAKYDHKNFTKNFFWYQWKYDWSIPFYSDKREYLAFRPFSIMSRSIEENI